MPSVLDELEVDKPTAKTFVRRVQRLVEAEEAEDTGSPSPDPTDENILPYCVLIGSYVIFTICTSTGCQSTGCIGHYCQALLQRSRTSLVLCTSNEFSPSLPT